MLLCCCCCSCSCSSSSCNCSCCCRCRCRCLSIYLSVCLSICLSVYLPVYLHACLSASLKTQPFCDTFSVVELDNIKNAAILRDFLTFWTWQHQKRDDSARRPQFSKLTTSKTKQFCETSFKNGKLSAELTAPYQCVLRFFHSICLKCCACHEKSDARSYEVLHLSRKIIFPKLKIWMHQNATPLRKSAPGPPNGSDEHVSCTAPAARHASCHILCICPTPAIVFKTATKPSRSAHFWQGAQPLAPPTRNDIWTSKSAPYPSVFLHFWLWNVLRATMACTFSTSQLPKVVRTWGVLYMLAWKCASRHNGVHFFDVSTSKSVPNVRCFSPPAGWGLLDFITVVLLLLLG